METLYLGIDLGGTNVAAAAVDAGGSILSRVSIPTPRGVETVVDTIEQAARKAAAGCGCQLPDFAAAGIGSPGIANPETGIVEYSCNLDFHDVPLAELLSQRLGLEVVLENDANAAALGEFAAGAGKGANSMVAVTLGTGVGGGVVIDRKLFSGFNHAGAELGHFVIEQDGNPCTCGRRGCFETYASATALIRLTRTYMEADSNSLCWTLAGGRLDKVNGRTAFDAMRQGDPTGSRIVEEYLEHLASGLVSIVNIFQPEVLCIGGGVSNEGDALLAPIQKVLDAEDYARNSARRTRLAIATLGNDAGLIGAAFLPLFR
ncbi:MAG: ROK family glucokinase [Oscillospiraceae bacterium]|nr:ROK family glucokinase [Oscillospiraceae bacterium]